MAASAGYFYKEKLLICPYNWAHSILKSRLQTHLVKCMKSYTDSGKVICPYDATHRVDSVELCEHIENCPAQVSVLSFKYSVGEPETSPAQFLPVVNRDIESSENWDDVTVSTYDPGHRLQDPNLLVQLKGATPSERKAFRRQREQLCQAANTGYTAESFIRKEPGGELDEAAGVTLESEEGATCATPLPPSLPPSTRLKNEQEMFDRNPRRRRESDKFESYNGAAQNGEAKAAKFRDFNKHFPTPGESARGRTTTANTGAISKSYKQAVKNSFESMIYDQSNTDDMRTPDNATIYSATMDTCSSRASSPDKSIFRKYKGPAISQKKQENVGPHKNKSMKNGLLGGEKHYTDSGFTSSSHTSNGKKAARGDTFDLGALGTAIPNDYKPPLPPSWAKRFKGQKAKMCDVMKGNNLLEAFERQSCSDETSEVSRDDGAAKFAGNQENQGCKKKTWSGGWFKNYDTSDSEDGCSGMDYAV